MFLLTAPSNEAKRKVYSKAERKYGIISENVVAVYKHNR